MKKRRVIFAILWIISLVGISFFGGAISYGFFFFLTAIPLVSYVYIFFVIKSIKYYQQLESRVMESGQALKYEFKVLNDSFFSFSSVKIEMYSDFSKVYGVENSEYEIVPGDEIIFSTKLMCRYRGEYEVGLEKLVITDFFRLFSFRYTNPGVICAIVTPRLIKLSNPKTLPDFTEYVSRENYKKGNVSDNTVREYVNGDSYRRIHWKSTARLGKLMVREQTDEEINGFTIVMETRRKSRKAGDFLPLENKMLELLLAINYYYATKNIPVKSIYRQIDTQQINCMGLENFNSVREAVNGIGFKENEKIKAFLEELLINGSLQGQQAVILIVSELDDELMLIINNLETLGVNLVVYVVTNDNIERFIKCSSLRVHIIPVGTEQELEGMI